MKSRGKFKFKSLVAKEGGEFINNKGEKVPYKASYALKVDEITEEGIFERTFKLAADSIIVKDLQTLEPYTDVIIDFDVKFYSSNVSLIPIAVSQK